MPSNVLVYARDSLIFIRRHFVFLKKHLRYIIRTKAFIFALFLPIVSSLSADEKSLTLSFPLIDLPAKSDAPMSVPSMAQSLAITKNFYQYVHLASLDRWSAEYPRGTTLSLLFFDFMSTWMPLGSSWLHEEWHRAAMGREGINSYDEVNDLPFFSEAISVSDIDDSSLAGFKKNDPAGFIRMHSAGIEAQLELNLALEKDLFFSGIDAFNEFLLWSNVVNSISYSFVCASNESDNLTNDILSKEDENIRARDFTGLDCNAWVYDLFRPNEPYADRGIHPSGNGVNRYIRYSDLSSNEKKYLKRQAVLSLLNIIDPFLIYKRKFYWQKIAWNANIRHHYTPFGNSIDINTFVKHPLADVMVVSHLYSNYHSRFYGIEMEIIRHKLRQFEQTLVLTPRIMLWTQPRHLSFETSTERFGGLISVNVASKIYRNWEWFVELESKTTGWVAGNAYLEPSKSFRAGLNYQFARY